MIFSSLSFLLVFLPVLVIVFFTIPSRYNRARKYILLLASALFYAVGEPIYILLVAVCILITWTLSERIENGNRYAYIVAIVINVSQLVFFKYTGFILENISCLTGLNISAPSISLPIGISFYTFQIVSYITDLFKGKIKRQKSISSLALYILFFPQLIAGPIVRYQDVCESIENNRVSWSDIYRGTRRFIIGLSKKVLIANQVGYISTKIMSNQLQNIPRSLLWLAVLSYSLQIYFDFSGYSDMAIGLGAIFGFVFPENFRRPYMATSISDFWRRWHITLGTFFRDYVYIPLGGNRVSGVRWIFNISVVWFLTGLWHGASWNFAIWGVYYGFLLVIEKQLRKLNVYLPTFIRWLYTMLFVVIGWGIFMLDGYTISQLRLFIRGLFVNTNSLDSVTLASMGLYGYLLFFLLGIIIATPIGEGIAIVTRRIKGIISPLPCFRDIVLICLLILCVVFIEGESYNPFIYYRF